MHLRNRWPLVPATCANVLANLITSRAALEYDSVTVNRLRRVSTRRRGKNTA
ncbi:DUF3263 domain-containing protein [Mycolicibacterium frederiksbergense]|uniref:DUF3263 domain-containing protein n=1 Tax=Mycolicibacterium frederiksbergense TaxID=117567 RepID=UPI003556A69B